jgi:uncharacterized protein
MIRRESTERELDAFEGVARRLQGFDARLSLEWIDGALAALLAGPRVPEGPEDALEPLFGDSWARTFADPEDHVQALGALQARWRVLRSQLDPEALWDEPDALRLAPLLLGPVADPAGEPTTTGSGAGTDDADIDGVDDAAGDAAVGPDEPADEGPRSGLEWVRGFLSVVDDPAWGWDQAKADEGYEISLAVLRALALDDVEACRARLPALLVEPDLSAEGLIDQACWQAQDLRLWWIENAPRTAPRRVEAQPGRNDPCPCGSGKKFKKCHGAG